MKRAAVVLVLIGVFMNATPALISGLGINDALGITAPENADLRSQEQQADKFAPSSSGGGDLFGVQLDALNVFGDILTAIFPIKAMLENMGVPDAWTDFLFTGYSFVTMFAIFGALRGVDL